VLLTVKVKVLSLDILKLIILCAECVDVSNNPRVSKMVQSIVNNKAGGAAGVEDGVVSVFGTWTIEIWGWVRLCMKGGAVNFLVFAFCSLMNDTIVH